MDYTLSLISHIGGTIHVWTFENILENPNPNPNQYLGHAKPLKLTQYGYRVKLNIESLEEEGVPVF